MLYAPTIRRIFAKRNFSKDTICLGFPCIMVLSDFIYFHTIFLARLLLVTNVSLLIPQNVLTTIYTVVCCRETRQTPIKIHRGVEKGRGCIVATTKFLQLLSLVSDG